MTALELVTGLALAAWVGFMAALTLRHFMDLSKQDKLMKAARDEWQRVETRKLISEMCREAREKAWDASVKRQADKILNIKEVRNG